MTIIPPVSGVQAGHSTGGGFLDTIKNTVAGITGGATTGTGATAQVDPGPKGDGSVGLFDGVLKKALISGAAGVAIGFIPFLPGGPVLGGIMGAIGGAAMGVFGNWMKMKQIKQENEALLAGMGVQVQQPEIQQVLQSGNVSQLIPMMQQAQGTTTGATAQVTPTQQQAIEQQAAVQQQAALAAQQQQGIAQGTVPAVVDPAIAGIQQSPVPTQGTVTVGSGGVGAINPNVAVDPGVAPALVAQGGGGVSTAAEGAVQVNCTPLSNSDIQKLILQLDEQIKLLREMIADSDRARARREADDAAAAEAQAQRAA